MTSRGRRLGAYETVRLLGAGGMGEVYLARHRHLGRLAAVKILLPEVSIVPEAAARFLAEARAAALIEHPAIVQVFDCDVLEDGRAFIVMEYLRGESLRAAMDRLRSFAASPQLACAIIGQAAEACGAAHAKGIVHRDLKPDNLFLSALPSANRIQVKVLDFGIAKLLQADQAAGLRTRTGVLLGTPRYMSPEQCRGSVDVDARADVYSLGCVLYELLAGVPPFDRQTVGDLLIAHATEPAPPLRSVVPDTPLIVADLVDRMLAKEPSKRPQSMDAVVSTICEVLGCPRERLAEHLHAPPGFTAPAEEALPPAPTPASISDGVSAAEENRPAALEAPQPRPETVALSQPTAGTTFGTSASEVFAPATTMVITRKRALVGIGATVGAALVVAAVIVAGRRTGSGIANEPAPLQTPPAASSAVVTKDAPKEPPRAQPSEPVATTVRVMVESRPPGASVWLSGEGAPRGETPLSLELPRGTTPLRAKLRAANHLDLTVELPVDRDARLAFELVSKPQAAPRPASRKRPPAEDNPFRPVGD